MALTVEVDIGSVRNWEQGIFQPAETSMPRIIAWLRPSEGCCRSRAFTRQYGFKFVLGRLTLNLALANVYFKKKWPAATKGIVCTGKRSTYGTSLTR